MHARPLPWLLVLAALPLLGACDDPEIPASSFYDERINPIVNVGCVVQTTGCHLAADDGTAAGNLDMSSFDALMRRDDVLPAYGPYPLGLLMLKGGEPVEISVETWDESEDYRTAITTDVRHNGGSLLAVDSSGFGELRRWTESGFQRNGVIDDRVADATGACNSGVGSSDFYDADAPPIDAASFDSFGAINDILRRRCAGIGCHSSDIADFQLSCGTDMADLKWNYWVTVGHLTEPVSTSELLRRPLAQVRGGSYHEGGNVFASTEDPDYDLLFRWSQEIADRNPAAVHGSTDDPGLEYFVNRVQPVLVRKGCMFLNCHSPAMFHDLRFNGGATGVFSRQAIYRNYEQSLLQLGIQSADPNDSRIIAKNLFPPSDVDGAAGISHRGGSLFEDFGLTGTDFNTATADDCAPFDADNDPLDDIPGYCVLARWHEIERNEAIAAGEIMDDATIIDSVVYIARPPGTGGPRDFDTFRGGADLRSAPAMMDASGSLSLGPSASLLGGCGIAAGADVRTPAANWGGARIAFAARDDASAPLRLYWMATDGSGCERVPGIAPSMDSENGILTHDFDPAFSPDGRLVFASTRGNLDRDAFPYSGPTRTPAAMEPNANLYLLEDGEVRQLTFLLNQEVAPSFMADGRVIFTAEKREPEFHQIALRRQNLDGGDYHPLFAQRGSVGFASATEVIELPNRNLAFIAAPLGAADGAGTLVVSNRSIGPDQDDRPAGERGYIHSMRLPVPGAFGSISGIPSGPGGSGVFRSPAALPSGHILLSCDLGAGDLTTGSYVYELCEMDPDTSEVRVIGGEAGMANVEAVAIYGRPNLGVFASRVDEPNAHTRVEAGERNAIIHVSDFPVLATLLFSNTRVGRPLNPEIGGFDVLEAMPPPVGTTGFGDVAANIVSDDFGMVFVDYQQRGHVNLEADGSAIFEIDGGAPMVLRATTSGGTPLTFGPDAPFTGEMIQREQMQFYPGERSNQSLQRRFFNGLCGGCHGALSGRELDQSVDVDILTGASVTQARTTMPINARR